MGGIPLTAIFFDMDGTLVDFDSAMRGALGEALAEMARYLGPLPDWLTVGALAALRDEAAADLADERLTHEEIRVEGFRRALARLGCHDANLCRRLASYYLERRYIGCRPYPDVPAALRALAGRYTLGIVSNGNSYAERCGLDGAFSLQVFSQDHGIAKPDPRLFEIALRQAGCTAEEALHVGDSLETDVAGARAAGIAAVWLNRDGAECCPSPVPDHEIRSLEELPALCDALRGAVG